MEFHNPLGLAYRPSTLSSTHDSSAVQLGTSDAKDLETRTQTIPQSLTKGTKEKGANIKVAFRPKSSHPMVIPSYNYASKYPQNGKVEKSSSTLARQIARGSKFKHGDPNKSLSEARRGKANKQPIDDEEVIRYTDLPQVTAIPATMFTLKSAPTKEDAFYFDGVVKGYSTLDNHYVNGEKPAFLDLPIASGDWSGVRLYVFTLKGRTTKTIRLFGKVTWGRVLKRLHQYHPTGTYHDVAVEDDDDPENYWEFFKVGFSLMYSSL